MEDIEARIEIALHHPSGGDVADVVYDEVRDKELTAIIKKLVHDRRANRVELGDYFLEKHEMLARPGCKGRWEPFLHEIGYPKESARRLLEEARQRRALLALGESGPNGAIAGDEDELDEDKSDEEAVASEPAESEPKPEPGTEHKHRRPGETFQLRFPAGSKAEFTRQLDWLAGKCGQNRREVLVTLVACAYLAAQSPAAGKTTPSVVALNEELVLPVVASASSLLLTAGHETEAA